MNGAVLILLGVLLVTGLLLKLFHKPDTAAGDDAPAPPAGDGAEAAGGGGECCGLHMTCERDSLVAGAFADGPDYYDDEELDAFAGREAASYTAAETEAFRDVLLTLRPDDIAGWARSITQRGIELPPDVRDELLLIVGEARAARAATTKPST